MVAFARISSVGPHWPTVFVVAGMLACAPSLSAAQAVAIDSDDAARGPLQGIVLDESSLEPIASASVSLVGTDLQTTTDADGAFGFDNPPFGTTRVRVASPLHASVVEEVELRTDRIVRVEFHLPPIRAALSEFIVTGRSEVGLHEPQTAADLLATQIPGLFASPGALGEVERAVRLRGTSSFILGTDQPPIFLDGARLGESVSVYDILTQIPASDVEEIEILRGPAAAFLYPFAADGVILIRTTRGGR